MIFTYSQKFKKEFKKLSSKLKTKFHERMIVFVNDNYDQVLNNHKLHGDYNGFRSINISSDIRVVYKTLSEEETLLYRIGSHSQLYE